jgi:hypothetical protein
MGLLHGTLPFDKMKVNKDDKIIKLKGDGKKYELRIKTIQVIITYISSFTTSGDWQEIEISLKDMYPSFREENLIYQIFLRIILKKLFFNRNKSLKNLNCC